MSGNDVRCCLLENKMCTHVYVKVALPLCIVAYASSVKLLKSSDVSCYLLENKLCFLVSYWPTARSAYCNVQHSYCETHIFAQRNSKYHYVNVIKSSDLCSKTSCAVWFPHGLCPGHVITPACRLWNEIGKYVAILKNILIVEVE